MDETLINGNSGRQTEWTESIAVGSKNFTSAIKEKFGIISNGTTGREIISEGEEFQLREPSGSYNAVFDTKKGDIGVKNTYYWDNI